MNYKIIFFCFFFLQISYLIDAQDFTKIEISNAVGVYNGNGAWFDFDNDDDLDFIITGQSSTNDLHTIIYENKGNDIFETYVTLQGLSETGLELMNINNDSDIDFLISGRNTGSNKKLQFYLNDNGSFNLNNLLEDFEGTSGYPTILSGDLNNDLYTDIFISGINGYDNDSPIFDSFIYLGDSEGNYTRVPGIDNPVYLSDGKLLDIDGDMDLDLILSGSRKDNPYQSTEVYLNNGDAVFTIDANNVLIGIQNSSMDIGDYDGDGDLDLIITGYNEFIQDTTLLYKNNNGQLSLVEGSGLKNHIGSQGSVKWGDFDNDGDLDLLFNGGSSDGASFEIMSNNGNDTFTKFDETSFENLEYGFVAWGDYDSDGDLDILSTGYEDPENPRLIIYKNEISLANENPLPPSSIKVSNITDTTFISWDGGIDSETPNTSLSYNINISNGLNEQLYSSFSNLANGKRKVANFGNIGMGSEWYFRNLEQGIYKIQIQTIDGGLLASVFSDVTVMYKGLPGGDPDNLNLARESGGVKLTWNDNSLVEQYFMIERKLDDQEVFQVIDSVETDVNFYIDHKLPPSYSASYRVFASNPNGETSTTSEENISYDGAPSNLVLNRSEQGLELSFQDNSNNEDYFYIERRIEFENSFELVDSITVDINSYLDLDFPDSQITYRVNAGNIFGASNYSNEAQIVYTSITNSSNQNYTIGPNPFTNTLNINWIKESFKIFKIEIYDLMGAKVFEIESSNPSIRIDLSHLKSGSYVLKNEENGATRSYHLIKK